MAHQVGAYPGFRSIKRLGVFLLPPGWDASPSHGYPQHYFAGTHLYTWVERSTIREDCLAQEHNKLNTARGVKPESLDPNENGEKWTKRGRTKLLKVVANEDTLLRTHCCS